MSRDTVLPPIKVVGVDFNEYCAVGLLKLLGHGSSSVLECLPSMHKALGSVPSTAKLQKCQGLRF